MINKQITVSKGWLSFLTKQYAFTANFILTSNLR